MRDKDDPPMEQITERKNMLTELELANYRLLTQRVINATLRRDFYSLEAKRAGEELISLQSEAAVMKTGLSSKYGGKGSPNDIKVDSDSGEVVLVELPTDVADVK